MREGEDVFEFLLRGRGYRFRKFRTIQWFPDLVLRTYLLRVPILWEVEGMCLMGDDEVVYSDLG
jgi:hypothetical protein